MSSELVLANLLNYSWQLVALVGVGIALPMLFRLREPSSHLIYLQALLLAALLLPALEPWVQPVALTFRTLPANPGGSAAGVSTEAAAWNGPELALAAMLAGTLARMAWIALGLWRLRCYRATAIPLRLNSIEEARRATGCLAPVSQSDGVAGPATFGFLRPLVLLPASIAKLPDGAQFAVVAHELLHVRRADWLFALAEELITAVLWWHPAIWVLVARIRLVREQVIDRAVVDLTASPQPYVEALLTLADCQPQPSLGPNFLRRRQLAVRIHSLLSEVTMSRTRIVATYSLITALVSASAYLSTTAFPLQAAPQFAANNNTGVTGAEVVLRKNPVYPSLARQKRIEGTVLLSVDIAEDGSAADARVLSGPQELRRAALEAVLQWQFKRGQANAQVTIDFRLQSDSGPSQMPAQMGKLTSIRIADAPAGVAETLRARLAHLEGKPTNAREISEIVAAVAPGYRTFFVKEQMTGDVTVTISDAAAGFAKGEGPRIRIGGNVQAAKLVNKVTPLYPPLAKQAGIQGTVRFATLIGTDGHVKGLILESGHPLLVESAQTAVQQWTYQPTLLNGNPVEVLTVIDVNYTLAP